MHFGDAAREVRREARLRPGDGIDTVIPPRLWPGEADSRWAGREPGRRARLLARRRYGTTLRWRARGPRGFLASRTPACGPGAVRLLPADGDRAIAGAPGQRLLRHCSSSTTRIAPGMRSSSVWDAMAGLPAAGLTAADRRRPGPANGSRWTCRLPRALRRGIDWAMLIFNPLGHRQASCRSRRPPARTCR